MSKQIIISASVRFYQQVVETKQSLVRLGHEVIIPPLAVEMEKRNDYVFEHFIDSFYHGDVDSQVPEIIYSYFQMIRKADSLLVVNLTKHGLDGYIGGNVLMEMGMAYADQKPIYLLYPANEELPYISEIKAMGPIVLDGDLSLIA